MPLDLAQFIAYVTLTITGLIVAIVSVRFSYLQNFGLKPIFMRTSIGLKFIGGKEQYTAVMRFEFWNRQKYPLVVRGVNLTFKDLEFITSPTSKKNDSKWYIQGGGKAYYKDEHAVSPSEHVSFDFEGPFEKRSLDDLSAPVTISVSYFDPRRNKHRLLKIQDTFTLND